MGGQRIEIEIIATLTALRTRWHADRRWVSFHGPGYGQALMVQSSSFEASAARDIWYWAGAPVPLPFGKAWMESAFPAFAGRDAPRVPIPR